MHWQPTINLVDLKQRAEIYSKIRDFFSVRSVLEVETPVLTQATVTDPHLTSLSTYCPVPGKAEPQKYYLHTSPEYAMKRLLAAGSGPIYQISKVFRADMRGALHNPEFSLLEWYRPGFTHGDLMIEVDALLRRILHCEVAHSVSYGALFAEYCQLNPYDATLEELQACAARYNLDVNQSDTLDVTGWLQLLMMYLIEPKLGQNNRPTFVTDFPVAQAALAKINPGPPAVAERFEVYWQGMELANGFHELCDPVEQRRRFTADNAWRMAHGLPEIVNDERFLAALTHGLPACAGVALGLDRLVMAALQQKEISAVLAFPIECA
jgi:elongation factor P--(R)-beta-lysine ligase